MTSRLTCSRCASVFNQKFHNVTADTPCPKCGGELVRRDDDTKKPWIADSRSFANTRWPSRIIIEEKGLLKEVNATAGRDAVFNHLYYDVREDLPNDPN